MFERLMSARMLGPEAALRRARALIAAEQRARAFPLLARAAAAQHAEAEFHIARCYFEGAGVPQSLSEGLRWLERAAGRDYVEAQNLMAAMCLQGVLSPGTEVGDPLFATSMPQQGATDWARARIWAERAAAAGSPEGQATLAFILTIGPEEGREAARAAALYEASARSGWPHGCLGWALQRLGRASADPEVAATTDYAEIRVLMARAAAAGLPMASAVLG